MTPTTSPSESAAPPSQPDPQSRPRARKRSLFGKAPKPTVPSLDTLPLPARGERSPSSSSITSTASQQSEKLNTPWRPSRLRSHGRSPSTSLAVSSSVRHDLGEDKQEGGGTPTQNLEQGISASPPSGSSPSPWYQRNHLSRPSFGLLSGGSNSQNRGRSASVNDQVPPARTSGSDGTLLDLPSSPHLEGTSHRWTGSSSPSQLLRTFSRRSAFSMQSETVSGDVGARTDAIEEVPVAKEKRKLFSRASRTATADSSTSSKHPTELGTSPADIQGLARQHGNGSLLRPPRDEFMASSDSLASTSTTSTSRGLSRRATDVLSRATWKRKDNTTSAEAALVADTTIVVPAADRLAATEEAVPKRLSGWLSNMLSGDGNVSELQASYSVATLKNAPPSKQVLPQSITSARSLPSAAATPRSRTAGLLSTLAATGRARADAAQSTSGNASGARSGLDRALRYFLDSNDDSSADEGIWLLGVWHGPSEERTPSASIGLGPALDMSEQGETTAASSKRCSDLDHNDDSSLASSAQRTRGTSPSIGSGSSKGSVRKKQDTNRDASDVVSGDEDNAVVARNPPTPHTSPSVPHIADALRHTDATTDSGASLMAAVVVTAEKTFSFQIDFGSRIWCTYRSHFTPIARDGAISCEAESSAADAAAAADTTMKGGGGVSTPTVAKTIEPHSASGGGGSLGAAFGISVAISPAPLSAPASSGVVTGGGGLGEKMGIPTLWTRATAAAQAYGFAGRTGLTTDAGWGCMLRTGQSLLANALLTVHLGRGWRRVVKPLPSHVAPRENEGPTAHRLWRQQREQYARYTRLLTWFMDEPSLACPFGVHRMAREGKRLGKEVGEWFGPSTASGAIQRLVEEFPACGLGVCVASDGVIYLDRLRAQAQLQRIDKVAAKRSIGWARPVLVLIGIRLGLEGVHPMYHDSVKATFSFPHSVGIAGGRPSSSYYFVGYQGNSLFYLDPHHVRPSVPFNHPPPQRDEDAEWWCQAYSEHDLATFHNDRPRRMPMKSLDPSMLLGFLIEDEASLQDFGARVKGLSRPIFSVQESMPTWMLDNADDFGADEEKAVESISESEGDRVVGGGEESDGDGLVAVGPRGLTSDVLENNGNTPSTCSLPQEKGKHAKVVVHGNAAPRSESTFEFVERHPPPPPPPPPIAFPKLGSANDVESLQPSDTTPIVGSGGLVDKSGQDFANPAAAADDDDNDESYDQLDRRPSPSAPRRVSGASDIDSAWEDLRPDVLQSSPQSALYVLRRQDSIDDGISLGSPATSVRKASI